jgi:hypothetical protein
MPSSADRSPLSALADAARAEAARRLGRVRLPAAVVVRLTVELELESVSVELMAIANDGGHRLAVGEAFRDVVTLLARAGHRLTTSQVMAGLDGQGTPHGDGPVKAMLAAAVRDGLLTNKPATKPPGYGLPAWPQ